MDSRKLTEAIRLANTIVSTHGFINSHMRTADREYQLRIPSEGDVRRRYDFHMDPLMSAYSYSNCTCTLSISYNPLPDREIEGEIRREYKRTLKLSSSGMDLEFEQLPARENFIQGITMLGNMLASMTPEKVEITILDSQGLIAKKDADRRAVVGERIADLLGRDKFMNLRRGGASRSYRFPEQYQALWGDVPENGDYTWKQIRRRDRRGQILDHADFRITVKNSCVTVSRIDAKPAKT